MLYGEQAYEDNKSCIERLMGKETWSKAEEQEVIKAMNDLCDH